MTATSDVDDLMQHAATLLDAGINNDGETVADTLEEVLDRGLHYTYAFVVGLAYVTARAFKRAQGETANTGWIPVIQDAHTGKPVNAETAGPDTAFAARFITAACNEDSDLMLDLWGALRGAGDPDAVGAACVTLVQIAIAAVRGPLPEPEEVAA